MLHRVTSPEAGAAASGPSSVVSASQYRSLAAATFASPDAAAWMADLLCARLGGGAGGGGADPAARLATLRAALRISEAASRRFRERLREQDERLRAAEAAGGGGVGIDGSKVDEEARRTARALREYLFSEEVLAADSSPDPESPPDGAEARMPGMGSSSSGGGFGSANLDRGSFTDGVLNFLERVLSPGQDEKAEVLSSCLRPSGVGEYQPVEVPFVAPMVVGREEVKLYGGTCSLVKLRNARCHASSSCRLWQRNLLCGKTSKGSLSC